MISIEPYWKNVIGSIERTDRLFRDVPSPALKLVMDPCNYFRKADLPLMQPMLKDIFQRVGRQTVLAHAKDVKAAANADDTELPYAGKGVLDYPLYLETVASAQSRIAVTAVSVMSYISTMLLRITGPLLGRAVVAESLRDRGFLCCWRTTFAHFSLQPCYSLSICACWPSSTARSTWPSSI